MSTTINYMSLLKAFNPYLENHPLMKRLMQALNNQQEKIESFTKMKSKHKFSSLIGNLLGFINN